TVSHEIRVPLFARARRLFRQEEPLRQTTGSIEEVVVKNRFFIVEPCSGADHGLPATGGIPSKTCGWTEIMSGNAHTIAQTSPPEIQYVGAALSQRRCRNRGIKEVACLIDRIAGLSRNVAVRSTGVAYITQAEVESQIGADLPGVAHIPLNPVVRPEPAAGQAEGRLFRGEALAVAHEDEISQVVQRIAAVAGEGRHAIIRGIGVHSGRRGKELCEPAAL